MCNKRYTSKTKNKEIRSVSGKTDSPMSLLFCSRFSGWILYWRMDAIPRNPSYSASFSPIIFLLHNPFLISLYLGLNMYISKDDDYVPTFESPWIHRGCTPASGTRKGTVQQLALLYHEIVVSLVTSPFYVISFLLYSYHSYCTRVTPSISSEFEPTLVSS